MRKGKKLETLARLKEGETRRQPVGRVLQLPKADRCQMDGLRKSASEKERVGEKGEERGKRGNGVRERDYRVAESVKTDRYTNTIRTKIMSWERDDATQGAQLFKIHNRFLSCKIIVKSFSNIVFLLLYKL